MPPSSFIADSMGLKILMVCHGNICRSPMAKGIMIHKLAEMNIKDVEVDSAGTSDYHAGEAPDARTIANGKTHGIDVSSYRAKQFKSADFEKFDRIYAMDAANYADIMLLAESEKQNAKVRLFLNAADPKSHGSVPDPWYGGPEGFEKVFHILDKACTAIAKEIGNAKLP
jgi:protein-tyrosine phosphatase